jgi:hypothetical protein
MQEKLTASIHHYSRLLRQSTNKLRDRVAQGPVGRRFAPLFARMRSLGLLSSPNRFVLTIGDEGGTLVCLRHDVVTDALFVAADAEEGFDALLEALAVDPQAQLLIAVDVLEQMYREEKLPRVGRFDRLTIIRRRLDVAFPHDRMKASATLDAAAGGGSTTCLFMALPVTPYMEKWIAFLEGLPNPLVGFCLLPLESEGIAAKLAPEREKDDRRVWNALVTQQATSGFRQIFESGGNLVVTRLTQRPPGELSAEASAQLIERELRSSISYIKRLAYSEADRLDLVVIANREVCAAVSERSLPVTSLTTLTPREAGETLGFGEVGPEDGPFSDVLHAVNLARKKAPRTILPTEKMEERSLIEFLFKASFAAASLVTLLATFYALSLAVDAYDTIITSETLKTSIATENVALASFRQRTKEFEVSLDDLVTVTQADGNFLKAQIAVPDLMRKVVSVLDSTMIVQSVSFNAPITNLLKDQTAEAAAARTGQRKVADGGYDLALTLLFPGQTLAQEKQVVALAKQFRDRLAKEFEGTDVTIARMPFANLRTQALQGSAANNGGAAKSDEQAVAEFLIRKKAS